MLAEGMEVIRGPWSPRLVPERHSRNDAKGDKHSRKPHGKKITRLL